MSASRAPQDQDEERDDDGSPYITLIEENLGYENGASDTPSIESPEQETTSGDTDRNYGFIEVTFSDINEAPLNPSGYEAERYGPRVSVGHVHQSTPRIVSMEEVVGSVLSPLNGLRATQGSRGASHPTSGRDHATVGNPSSQRWGNTALPPSPPAQQSSWSASLLAREGPNRESGRSSRRFSYEGRLEVPGGIPIAMEELHFLNKTQPVEQGRPTTRLYLGLRNDENVERPWIAEIARDTARTRTIRLLEFQNTMEAILRMSHQQEELAREIRGLLARLADTVLEEIEARVNASQEDEAQRN